MNPDDEICICHHVPLRKLAAYLERERPKCASQLSECLGAGTGCGWCIPTLQRLHQCAMEGTPPGVGATSEEYALGRQAYKDAKKAAKSGQLDPETDSQ